MNRRHFLNVLEEVGMTICPLCHRRIPQIVTIGGGRFFRRHLDFLRGELGEECEGSGKTLSEAQQVAALLRREP